jgi:hypothetical protein
MNCFVKTAIVAVFGLSLASTAEAGGRVGHVGHVGRVGHVGARGVVARGVVARGRLNYAVRWHGAYSHRWWDRRFNRWLYFNPVYRGWYSYVPATSQWVVVNDGVPAEPAEDTPVEVIPPAE